MLHRVGVFLLPHRLFWWCRKRIQPIYICTVQCASPMVSELVVNIVDNRDLKYRMVNSWRYGHIGICCAPVNTAQSVFGCVCVCVCICILSWLLPWLVHSITHFFVSGVKWARMGWMCRRRREWMNEWTNVVGAKNKDSDSASNAWCGMQQDECYIPRSVDEGKKFAPKLVDCSIRHTYIWTFFRV